jgi:hypothetical protein
LGGVVVVLLAVFAGREPFDGMHQKRLFVLHAENVVFFCGGVVGADCVWIGYDV